METFFNIFIDVECLTCGNMLEVEYLDETLRVEPCEKCLEEAKQAGFDQGNNSGHDIGYQLGHTNGYQLGKSEGYKEGHTDGFSDVSVNPPR